MNLSPYWILAFYSLVPLEDPHREVKRQKEFFCTRDMKGRLYLSEQGINGQMSASRAHAQEYMAWMKEDPRFADVSFKIHDSSEHAFEKATIKYRAQLVALDCEVDMSQRGESLSSKEWKEKLEARDEHTIVLDVRNAYEWKIGHFEGAELPPCETFREFPAYARNLAKTRDVKNCSVMMYCTGGIRCEFYSALLKKEGFEKVYQLEGGVIQYGQDEGNAHWRGKLFVFDDRLAVPMSEEGAEPISTCSYCQQSCDTYLNCANMDCNALFLCCQHCLPEHQGCCSVDCVTTGRIRPYARDGKPFRRWPAGEKRALSPN